LLRSCGSAVVLEVDLSRRLEVPVKSVGCQQVIARKTFVIWTMKSTQFWMMRVRRVLSLGLQLPQILGKHEVRMVKLTNLEPDSGLDEKLNLDMGNLFQLEDDD
jgi:hypothetical protein